MITRRIYQIMLRLHPRSFRERFADEMLWIFDRSTEHEGDWRLLSDAAFSLLKQHLAVDTVPRFTGRPFQRTHADSLHAIRFVQAGAIAVPLFVGFICLAHEPVPLPEPPKSFAVRTYRPDVCAELVPAVRISGHSQRSRITSFRKRSRP